MVEVDGEHSLIDQVYVAGSQPFRQASVIIGFRIQHIAVKGLGILDDHDEIDSGLGGVGQLREDPRAIADSAGDVALYKGRREVLLKEGGEGIANRAQAHWIKDLG